MIATQMTAYYAQNKEINKREIYYTKIYHFTFRLIINESVLTNIASK